MDWKLIITQAVATLVPLVLFVMAFVELLKKFGVTAGKWLTLGAYIFGVVLGGVVGYATLKPTDFVGWVIVVIYGLLLGFIGTGVYDTGRSILAP